MAILLIATLFSVATTVPVVEIVPEPVVTAVDAITPDFITDAVGDAFGISQADAFTWKQFGASVLIGAGIGAFVAACTVTAGAGCVIAASTIPGVAGGAGLGSFVAATTAGGVGAGSLYWVSTWN